MGKFDFSTARYDSNRSVPSNYSKAPYNTGYSKPPKRSGAKFGEKDGVMYVNAWKRNKRGFFTLFAWPYKTSKIKESEKGKEWISLFVTITNRDTMQISYTTGLYDIQRKRLYLKDLNQIVTRNGDGGYWGKHISRSYNR